MKENIQGIVSRNSLPKKQHPGAVHKALIILVALFSLSLLNPLRSFALRGQLNLNSATAEELELLPFTGKSRARAIITYRLKKGPFESIDEILKIENVGPSTYEAIKPYLKLSGPSTISIKKPAGPEPTQKYSLKVFPKISTNPGEVMLLPDQQYYDTLISFLKNADRRIELAMFIFKVSDFAHNRPSEVAAELIAARKRGVDVIIVLEKSGYDENINKTNMKVAKLLTGNKIKVQFDSKNITSHMKLVVVDNRFCFVGSHNLTQAALNYNHEFSILIDNNVMAQEIEGYIENIPEK